MSSPYVYKVINKSTNEFYFGHRAANKVEPENDLGIIYFSSNRTIMRNKDDFEFSILFKCNSQIEAFKKENELIKSNWGNPLLLNKHFQKSMSTFSMAGFKRPDLSVLNKKLKSKPKEIRFYICPTCKKHFEKLEHCHIEICPHFCSRSCVMSYTNSHKIRSPKKPVQTVKNLHPWKEKGRIPWNKGKPTPYSAENGKKGAKKASITIAGRKLRKLNDGSRRWIYKDDIGEYMKSNGIKEYLK